MGAIEKRDFSPYSVKDFDREEYCKGSTLHRVYYHPSPIYDLIVGNAKRGRLCAKATSPTQISHRFIFDCANRLVRVENFNRGQISYIEFLQHSDGKVMGLTLDCNGFLAAVSEEVYSNYQIASFSIANCFYDGDKYVCFNYHAEYYRYDAMGLLWCNFVNLSPQSGYLINKNYTFERENGLLVAYHERTEDSPGEAPIVYRIKKKRYALFGGRS